MVLSFGFIRLAGICASIFACFYGSTAIGQRETVVCALLFDLLARMHIRFTKVAVRAKGLQIFQNGFATFAPRNYVVNVKHTPGSEGRTCAAGASKTVTLKYTPAKP